MEEKQNERFLSPSDSTSSPIIGTIGTSTSSSSSTSNSKEINNNFFFSNEGGFVNEQQLKSSPLIYRWNAWLLKNIYIYFILPLSMISQEMLVNTFIVLAYSLLFL